MLNLRVVRHAVERLLDGVAMPVPRSTEPGRPRAVSFEGRVRLDAAADVHARPLQGRPRPERRGGLRVARLRGPGGGPGATGRAPSGGVRARKRGVGPRARPLAPAERRGARGHLAGRRVALSDYKTPAARRATRRPGQPARDDPPLWGPRLTRRERGV